MYLKEVRLFYIKWPKSISCVLRKGARFSFASVL